MVKVLTGVQPGQATEAEAEVIAGAPAAQLKERVPQAQGLDSLLAAAPVEDIAAGIGAGVEAEIAQQEDVAAQREREAVPDIISRRDEPPLTEWKRQGEVAAVNANSGPQSDGGMAARATNMAEKFSGVGEWKLGGLQSKHGGAAKEVATTVGAIDPEGNLNRDFLQMMSVITENQFSDLAFSRGEVDVQQEGEVAPEEVSQSAAITKAQGNKQLGDQIHREYQRYRNAQAGRPTDEYVDLTSEQATLLGDMAKEMYFEANQTEAGQNFMVRGAAPDGQVTFTLTKHGSDRLREGAFERKRLFPKQHVRPSKTPLPGGRLVGEGRTYTRGASGRTGTTVAGAEVIHQAMRNLNTVANVVDPHRLKILFATALPVLSGQVSDPNHPFAKINHIGQDKLDKFNAVDPETAPEEYAKLIDSLAQSLFGIATERNGANFLTYYMQTFNGRIAPQQTNFDPTTSKTTRFVTRNAVPAKATPGSRIEKNLRQMYAMMLVPKADIKLPEAREKALEQYTPQLVRWGKELRAALGGISDAQVNAIADAIANGTPMNDPNFPQIPDVSASISPDLAAAIEKKGEDGQAFIDGVMDFTDYYENKLKGRPHHSYFNAYMDGKTNGLASNGIQMGSEQVAYKTGVLRSQNEALLDGDVDIRDDLANTLVEMIDQNGFDGHVADLSGPLHSVATTLFNGKGESRNLHKATTMTFGYGKELDSFKNDIDEYLALMEQSDPELAANVQTLVEGMGDRETLIGTLHSKYVEGLANALDPNALKSRALMRTAAYLHALSNEIFTIESATGFELAMGGTETSIARGSEGVIASYALRKGDDRRRIEAKRETREVTSAAVKTRTGPEGDTTEEVGGYAYGGSVPAPVQSLDAATVALTASGKSWGRLKSASNGAPYLHTIYDAFKVDAMGYDVVLDEVNKNWLDAGMKWSYLEETQNALDRLRTTFQEKYGKRPDNSPLTEGEARQMMWFLEISKNKEGKPVPSNLINKMGKLIEVPANADSDMVHELSLDASRNIVKAMKSAGFDPYAPPTQPTVKHLKAFMKAFSGEVNIGPRLGKMVQETNNNKKKLAAKIKQDKAKVYQYYAH